MLERSSGGKRGPRVPGVLEWSGLEMYRLLGVEPTAIFKRTEDIFYMECIKTDYAEGCSIGRR